MPRRITIIKHQRQLFSLGQSTVIPECHINRARDYGLLLHHEYVTEPRWCDLGSSYQEWEEVTADKWHAAPPDWVDQYHQDGGIWGYID